MISSAHSSVNPGNSLNSPAAPKDSTSHCGRYVLRAVVGVAVVVSIVALAVFASPWTGGTSLAVGAFALCHVSTLLAPTVAACAGSVATIGGGVSLFSQSRGSQSSIEDSNERGSADQSVPACAGSVATIGGGVSLFFQSRGSQSSVGDSNERSSTYLSCSEDDLSCSEDDLSFCQELLVPEDPSKTEVTNFFKQMPIFQQHEELLTSIIKDLKFPLDCRITSTGGELEIKGLDPIGLRVNLATGISVDSFKILNRQEQTQHLFLLKDKPPNQDPIDTITSPTLGNLKYFGSLGPKLWGQLKSWSNAEPSQLLDKSNSITLTIDSDNQNRLRFQGLSKGLQNVIDTVDFDCIGSIGEKYCKISVNEDATLWQPVYKSVQDNFILEDLLQLITLTKV